MEETLETLDLFIQLISNLLPIFLIIIGYLAGTIAEKNHYKSIKSREKKLLYLPAITSKKLESNDNIANVEMVVGSAVISIDYFKRFLAILRNIFGGRVTSYESLVDRARREAIIRMKENAKFSDIIINTRIETSSIGKSANSKGVVGSVEAFAYGTAVKYKGTSISLDKTL